MLKFVFAMLLVGSCAPAFGAEEIADHTKMLMDHGDGHLMEMSGGMVMGQNTDKLPGGCSSIADSKEVTIRAGHKFAEKFPGRMWAFDTQELNFKPCTKLTIHFINEDKIRHQWMMHGLPKYLYPKGMFHLEVSGPGQISGTLILPPGDKTYLIHCDIAQHMEHGMKAQLKVGSGDGDLPSIPGVTAPNVPDDYNAGPTEIVAAAKVTAAEIAAANAALVQAEADRKAGKKPSSQPTNSLVTGTTVIGLAVGLILTALLGRQFRGKTVAESISHSFELLKSVFMFVKNLFGRLLGLVLSQKNKTLPSK